MAATASRNGKAGRKAKAKAKAGPAGKAPDWSERFYGERAGAVERFSQGPTNRELHAIARDMKQLYDRMRAFLDHPQHARAVRRGRGPKAASYLREDVEAAAYNLELFVSIVECQLVGDPLGEIARRFGVTGL